MFFHDVLKSAKLAKIQSIDVSGFSDDDELAQKMLETLPPVFPSLKLVHFHNSYIWPAHHQCQKPQTKKFSSRLSTILESHTDIKVAPMAYPK
jgi:hypothetical protein